MPTTLAESHSHTYSTPHRKHWLRRRKKVWIPLLTLVVIIAAVWIYLDVWTTRYVNRVLSNVPGYEASVSEVNVHLYRGAYQIHNLQMFKMEGKIPTPFIDIELVDLSIQWGALLHGRIVSTIELTKPILNFAKGKSGATQTGKNVDWTAPIKQLAPIDINKVTAKDGEIHYKDFSASRKVDLFVKDLNGEMTNLRNVEKKGETLPSDIHGTGSSIGDGKLSVDGKMNVLKEIPDMDLTIKLENAHLPAINNYVEDAAGIDFQSGNLSVYSRLAVKDSQVHGYVKPIATDVHILSLQHTGGPFHLAWESVVAFVVEVFTNHAQDQFATVVPLEGNLNHPDTSTWAALSGVFHNAFIHALSKDAKDDLREGKVPEMNKPTNVPPSDKNKTGE